MTSLGDDNLDLFETLLEEAGADVSVTRGANPPVVISAIRGRSTIDRFGSDEGYYGTSSRDDFIVRVADYISKVGGPPEVHDVIEWTDDGANVRRFQVGVDGLERQYDPVGQFGLLYRVHTTEIT